MSSQPLHSESPSGDGIEILVQMAKSGQIDPWHLDIVQVADQYLKAVAELKESDLKITGKTLLYLAILLRMKSDQLSGVSILYPPEEEFLDELMDADFMETEPLKLRRPKFTSLDEVIKRRTSSKQPRIRPVTLNDLILELKRYEELEKKRSLREKIDKVEQRRMMDYASFSADDIEELAHEEFLEDTIFQLKNVLERVLIQNEPISLSDLVVEGKIDKVSAYLALLFLVARDEIDLFQEAFYTELYIRKEETPLGETDFNEEISA